MPGAKQSMTERPRAFGEGGGRASGGVERRQGEETGHGRERREAEEWRGEVRAVGHDAPHVFLALAVRHGVTAAEGQAEEAT